MKRKNLLTSLTLAGALFALGNQVQATSWGDYSQFTGFSVTINSVDPANTTVLNTVTVVCPASGWLVATASTQFDVVNAAGIEFIIGYSITRDNVAPIAYDPNHYQRWQEKADYNSHRAPAGMQRVDNCTSGQSVTYKFVAYQRGNIVSVSAFSPRMTVQFISNTI